MEHTISYVYSIKQSDDSRFRDNHMYIIKLISFPLISFCK